VSEVNGIKPSRPFGSTGQENDEQFLTTNIKKKRSSRGSLFSGSTAFVRERENGTEEEE
jgi:hypothetical protein